MQYLQQCFISFFETIVFFFCSCQSVVTRKVSKKCFSTIFIWTITYIQSEKQLIFWHFLIHMRWCFQSGSSWTQRINFMDTRFWLSKVYFFNVLSWRYLLTNLVHIALHPRGNCFTTRNCIVPIEWQRVMFNSRDWSFDWSSMISQGYPLEISLLLSPDTLLVPNHCLWCLIFHQMWPIDFFFFSRFSCRSFIIRQNTQLNWRRDKFVGVQCHTSFVHFHVRLVTRPQTQTLCRNYDDDPIHWSKISSLRSSTSQPSLDPSLHGHDAPAQIDAGSLLVDCVSAIIICLAHGRGRSLGKLVDHPRVVTWS